MAIARAQSNNIAEIIRINAIGYSADFAGNRFQASLPQTHNCIADVSTQIVRQRNTEVLWIAFEQRRLMNASKIATCHFQFLLLYLRDKAVGMGRKMRIAEHSCLALV